ncbi:MAG: serine/threonine protein kinase, partial [Anaerolineae bacterium]|nr:serine/threonine protein kinase [Phycisphaerae bacterium]
MNSDAFHRAAELFLIARDLPPAARDEFLKRECGGNVELRDEVERLLAAQHNPMPFETLANQLESVRQQLDQLPAGNQPAVGDFIGRYKLLQVIGEGGFGTVYMAEQREPVHRRVALKVVKLGMDTRQVIARFEAERQALAIMDHPHVARVFDAGATDAGRPYFVMELVDGVPITEYCDKNRLSIERRLTMFAQVCQAVQHAHQKGLIHRDIKPSNILVTTRDDHSFAKVIDFGVAKATQTKLTEKTLFTEFRQLVGTPEYMSPEQAHGNMDVDTRSDIYSLG